MGFKLKLLPLKISHYINMVFVCDHEWHSYQPGLVYVELGNITILLYIVIFASDIIFKLQYHDIVFK